MKSANDGPRVLVVGAGFAGLSTMSRLARGGFRVTLADRHIYSTFQPLLYQVATAGLAPSDVAYPLRGFAHKYGARFRHGDLASLDTATRVAEFADGGRIGYDYLILATGVTAGFYGITGAAEYSHALYTLHDAVTMRERILAGLEQLSLDGARDVTVTIVGGGATGVELAGTLAELRNIGLPASYPGHPPAVRAHPAGGEAPYLLGPYVPPLREYARRQLVNRGVDLHLNAKIREITANRIILDSGEEIPSDLTAWAAGVAGPPGGRQVGPAAGQGGTAAGRPGPACGGRGADLRDRRHRADRRRSAAAARAARHPDGAARRGADRRLEAGQATVPFQYHDKGTMATIGSRSAVVQLSHGYGSAARSPGWPGWPCTWSRCWAAGTGSTR